MAALSRREFVQRLVAACGGAVLGGCHRTRTGDVFDREGVCIHIFHPSESVPGPLLEKSVSNVRRRPQREYFNMGLPELLVCESRFPLLDAFQYFWPFSRSDFETLQRAITLRYHQPTIDVAEDVEQFASFLRKAAPRYGKGGVNSAVIFTFHEVTRQWSPEIVSLCKACGVQEFIVFKDPTIDPYLCDYPAKQKGFKRPPP